MSGISTRSRHKRQKQETKLGHSSGSRKLCTHRLCSSLDNSAIPKLDLCKLLCRYNSAACRSTARHPAVSIHHRWKYSMPHRCRWYMVAMCCRRPVLPHTDSSMAWCLGRECRRGRYQLDRISSTSLISEKLPACAKRRPQKVSPVLNCLEV